MLDFQQPNYSPVFRQRIERLERLRQTPGACQTLKQYYRTHIAQFITDWGCTFDPRNPEIGLPAVVPFVLFERQVAWVNWFVARWQTRTPGLTEKSRQMGVSWLSVAVGVSSRLPHFFVRFPKQKIITD